ncbi:alpha/beta hydrolase [Streptomyces zagrosensis]|uniref:Pimeloyl-ACP methyl ester carboxylesterase n=1 Tax=Streptomyces zagrosensis TaxID=1042984 RepID=A0A7W9UZQ4_9ACTN|nr:alpha/beta fold hydrolase [Streptomyces zagrosensis]MBB5937290.1 pimeloyl-ACP methyl ester carboxylesterase [Streptomyces zagrosensis]
MRREVAGAGACPQGGGVAGPGRYAPTASAFMAARIGGWYVPSSVAIRDGGSATRGDGPQQGGTDVSNGNGNGDGNGNGNGDDNQTVRCDGVPAAVLTALPCDGERLSCAVTVPAAPVATATAASPEPAQGSGLAVVLLHGAGIGDKGRLAPLAAEFVDQGCRAVAFDFSGHGASTGELRELSLERRFRQACGVIDALVPRAERLILVGFSMSGQTVTDLVAHYGDRVAAIGLCAPAVYAQGAWPVRFGAGFTEIIRAPESWRSTGALDVLRRYQGRTVLVVPTVDEVIPLAVTEAVTEALAVGPAFTRLELTQATHQLGRWFRKHGKDRRRFVAAVLAGGARRAAEHEAASPERALRPCP